MNNHEQLLDEIRELSLQAKSEGRDVASMELLNAYLKHRPKDGPAWFHFGDLVREIGLKDEAERALHLALEFSPPERHGWIWSRLGLLHHEAGRYPQAEHFYNLACNDAEFKQYGGTWILRGANLAQANDLDTAEKYHRRALTFSDEYVDRDEAYLNLGYVLRAQGRYAESADAFQSALEITPDYAEALEAANTMRGVEDAMAKVKEIGEAVE